MKRKPCVNRLMNLAVVLAVSVCMLLVNVPLARADGTVIDISSVSSGGDGYTYSGGVVTITSPGDYTVTGDATSNTLAIADNVAGAVNLTLSGITIRIYHMTRSPFVIGANDNVNLILAGSNTLSAYLAYSYTDIAGITVPSTSLLTISGSGSLAVQGSGTGAGIGMADFTSGGAVTINGGSVSATGGYNDGNANAGIRGTVVINDGSVTATGGHASGGGSGSGLDGTVTINGGTVVAQGGSGNTGGAGIGGCAGESGGMVTINGGTVTATGAQGCQQSGAGIGGGRMGTGGTITINGGNVTANAGCYSAGIGGGYGAAGGTILITDQQGPTSVTATGVGGAGIGGGYSVDNAGATSVTIDGGTVIADDSSGQGAGIGGGYDSINTNTVVTINGGAVTATGGNKAAGIGGAYEGNGGTVNIGGGQVTAIGGFQAAGIGSGYQDISNGGITGGAITITGGTVQATGGGNGGAGIGGGMNVSAGTVAISGDATSVTATGTSGGAGIGGGVNQFPGEMNGNGGTITISGGTVAASGTDGGAGIGGGNMGCAGSVTVNGGLVTATADYYAAGIGSGRSSISYGQGANDVTVNGGRVYASGANGIPDIGGNGSQNYRTNNAFNGGSIRANAVSYSPKSGSINVYRTVISVINLDDSTLADAEVTYTVDGGASIPAATDGSGNLYLWLPSGDATAVEIHHGGDWYLATGAVTNDNAAAMEADQQTYEISEITSPTFAGLTEGYADGSQDTETVQFTNVGTGALKNLSVSLDASGEDSFDLGTLSATALASGDGASFTIIAKTGLSAGDHKATVTIKADRMDDVQFQVSQTVQLLTVDFMDDGSLVKEQHVHYNHAVGAGSWPVDPVKTGYDFSGWFTGDSVQILPGTAITQSMSLNSAWVLKEYSITYHLGNGTNDAANPPQYAIDNEQITLNPPVKAGYTFTGWSGTGVEGTSTDVTIPAGSTGDRAFTAHWTANTYTVQYDANGGSGTMAPGSFTYDASYPLAMNAFTKSCYYFAGWATSQNGPLAYTDGQTVANLTDEGGATITLHAVWTAQPPSACLSGITLSASSLSRAFSQNVTSYTVNLGELDKGVTVTPLKEFDGAVMTINGKTQPSIDVPVANGKSAVVTIKLTCGKQSKTYRVTVNRPKSTDDNLATLTVSGVPLDLDLGVTQFNVTIPEGTSKVTVIGTKANSLATVTNAKKTYTLKNNQTIHVTVKVRAQSGAKKTYEIWITRAPSTNADPLYIKTGSRLCPLAPAFSAGVTSYNVTLPANVSTVTISCKAANSLAYVTMDGVKRTSKTIKLARGQSVQVIVVFTAQAGNSSQPYTITITRS